MTGCGRFAASCVDPFGIGTALIQFAVIALLVLLPSLAAISAAGTLAGMVAALVAAVVVLSAGGGVAPAGRSDGRARRGADRRLCRRRGVRGGPETGLAPRTMTAMHRRHDTHDLSAAAQEYLLTLRVMAGDGSHVKAAQVARRMGVTTQAVERDVPAPRLRRPRQPVATAGSSS